MADYKFHASLLVEADSEEQAWQIASSIAGNLAGRRVSSERPGHAMLVFEGNRGMEDNSVDAMVRWAEAE